jgi:endonuclease I
VDGELEKALHDYAAPHKAYGYTEAKKLIFTVIDNHDGKVKCVYTGREIGVSGKVPSSSDMNIEHTWPQSKGAKGIAKSDMYHLFPTDSHANSIRGNFDFGKVVNVKWEENGAKFGTDAQGNKVFEPPDSHKGNVARAIFYFATVYGMKVPPAEEAVLKEWNHLDPVDVAERDRSDLIESYQNNRNPFVDDASLVDRISDF